MFSNLCFCFTSSGGFLSLILLRCSCFPFFVLLRDFFLWIFFLSDISVDFVSSRIPTSFTLHLCHPFLPFSVDIPCLTFFLVSSFFHAFLAFPSNLLHILFRFLNRLLLLFTLSPFPCLLPCSYFTLSYL